MSPQLTTTIEKYWSTRGAHVDGGASTHEAMHQRQEVLSDVEASIIDTLPTSSKDLISKIVFFRYIAQTYSGDDEYIGRWIKALERDAAVFAKQQRIFVHARSKKWPGHGQPGPCAYANGGTTTMKDSGANASERIRRLQEEIATVQAEAKGQLIARATEAIEELNRMGLDYRLVQGGVRARGRKAMIRQTDPSRPCPVCKFRTVPHHDARSHRAQGRTKKPFTATELQEFGLVRK